jgi:integrase
MTKRLASSPRLRLHKPSNNAVVTLRDGYTGRRRDYYCGRWGSPESIEAYARIIRVWESGGRRFPDRDDPGIGDPGCTTGEVLLEFWRWAQDYYTASEASAFRSVIRLVRDLYASTQACDFSPRRLEMCRDSMIERGWSRKSINRQVTRVRQIFGYGVRRGLVSVEVHMALKSVPALRRGKSAAREPKPVRPVPETMIEASIVHMSEPVAALVRCQLLTGARSGELVIMRPCDIERDGKVWAYRPTSHKTQHHDHERVLFIGPEAQRVIGALVQSRPPDAYVFSPLDAQGRASTSARRTRYTTGTLLTAITRACDIAFPPPVELARLRVPSMGRKHERWETTPQRRARIGEEGWEALKKWQHDHRWHPHQLRHNAATRLRKEFGIELARIVLGHKSAGITEVYAEADQAAAMNAMLKLG